MTADTSAEQRAETGSGARRRGVWWRVALEIAIVVAMWVVYNFGRLYSSKHTHNAFDHAHQIWDLERWMFLPSEAWVQHVTIDTWIGLIHFANGYYALVHFPLTIGMLVYLFVFRPTAYVWIRRALVAFTVVALLGFILYPLAPPRMLAGHGFVDTGVVYGLSVYNQGGTDFASNQFAAMPSVHVGWATLVAVAFIASGFSAWRWLWVLHPVVTVFVITVTANHYWLDGAVSVLMVIPALWLARLGLGEVRAKPARLADRPVYASRMSRADASSDAG